MSPRSRGMVRGSILGTLLAAGLGCTGVFEPRTVASDACACSLEVPGLWVDLDLVEFESLQMGSELLDGYVVAEWIAREEISGAASSTTTLADATLLDLGVPDPGTAPERVRIDGRLAATRSFLAVGDDPPVDYWHGLVPYPDGWLRIMVWRKAGQGVEELAKIGMSVHHDAGPPVGAKDAEALPQEALSPRATRAAEPEAFQVSERDYPIGDAPEAPEGFGVARLEGVGWRMSTPVADAPRPAALVVHTGYGLGDVEIEFMQALAAGGMTVMVPSLGGDPGTASADDLMGEEVDEVLAALTELRARPDVDPDRVVLVGIEQGAGTALLVAAETSEVAVVVAIDPPADLTAIREEYSDLWGDTPYGLSSPRQDEVRSPARYLSQVKVPVVALYGQYSDLVLQGALLQATALAHPDVPVRVAMVDRSRWNHWHVPLGAHVSAWSGRLGSDEGRWLGLDEEVLLEWSDVSWTARYPEIEAGLRDRVAHLRRLGLWSAERIAAHVVEDRGEVDQTPATTSVQRALAETKAAPVPPDGAQLAQAASRLRAEGLVVQLGSDDGVDGARRAVMEGTKRGYVVVSSADLEAAGASGALYLKYGAREPWTEEGAVGVGQQAAAALRGAGLEVDWDEDPSRTIRVVLSWADEEAL